MSDSRFPGPWEMNSGCGSRPACGVRHGRPEVTPLVSVRAHPRRTILPVWVFSLWVWWVAASVMPICRDVRIWTHWVTEVQLPSPSFTFLPECAERREAMKFRQAEEASGRPGEGSVGHTLSTQAPRAPRGDTVPWSKVPPPKILWRAKIGIKLVDQNSEDAKKIERDWQNNIEMSVFQRDKNLGKWYASVSSL